MAMTLAAATLKPCVEDLTNDVVGSIVVEKLAIACPNAIRDDAGIFLPVDSTGCWLFVGNNGFIELGEPAA